MPVGAKLHYAVLMILRSVSGAALGLYWPAIASLWAQWAPPEERSRLIGFANSGAQIGNVITLPLGSWLCSNGFAGGWGSIFYLIGN
jgi:predicted MFS family arabinose efflux permease